MPGTSNPRSLPLFPLSLEQRLVGTCPWCGGSTGQAPGMWHLECGREYAALSDTRALRKAVAERDGCRCALCRKPGWIPPRPIGARLTAQLDLEHRVPLWAVATLPIASRQAFFSAANLQLLCQTCHAAKTSGEASARAEMVRRAAASAGPRPDEPARSGAFDRTGCSTSRKAACAWPPTSWETAR